MRRLSGCLLFCLAAAPASGSDLVLTPGFSPRDLAELAAVMADAIAFPQLGEAPPRGLTGFHLVIAAGGPEVTTRADWWNPAMKDQVLGTLLLAPRAMGRKGLPMRFDVGAQVGKVFGSTFWGGEAGWGLVKGGFLLPAVGVSGSFCRVEDTPVALEIGEARLTVSKEFALIAPFASLGVRRERAAAELGEPFAGVFRVQNDRFTATAGVVVGVPPLRFVAEVRHAAATGFFFGLGVGR